MKKTRSTKRTLLLNALALITCISMLVGSTFAWFTDSVTSAGNKIQSGTLDLDLKMFDGNDYVSIKESADPLFEKNILWEPGYTAVRLLQVENKGSLALKWVAKFTSQTITLSKLAEVIDVYVCPSDAAMAMPGRDLAGYTKVGTLDKFINSISETTYGTLLAGQSAYLGIALKMQESAGNEYQNLDLGGEFDITILATQYTYEEDSFDELYDEGAQFDEVYIGTGNNHIEVRNNAGYKVAAFEVPNDAKVDPNALVTVKIIPGAPNKDVVIPEGKEAKGFAIEVLGLKENNDIEIKAMLRIGAVIDPDGVEVYHYGNKIVSSYDPHDGYVTFHTKDFSPFTVVYDADEAYVAPVLPEGMPVADVTKFQVPDEIEWGSYGQWSPTPGLEANLEGAYTFKCTETLDQAKENDFANWYCDFYVSLDRDLGANQIFLGGNYGDWGWIGFHNGDFTLEAGKELGLLESVTVNPWTYVDVVTAVGEFTCGVGDVDNALSGATFTVHLRLTNPENPDEFYNIQTINYTFQ